MTSSNGSTYPPDSSAYKFLAALQGYGLREEGPGQYRCKSVPWRPESDSRGFTVKIDGPELGTWTDHARGEHGSLYEGLDRLNIARPSPSEAPTTKRGYASLKDYAQAHYAPVSAFLDAGWKEAAPVDLPSGRRLGLPFQTANGMRIRFIDGEKPPYHSPAGYVSCWYKLPEAVQLATSSQLPLVLCNGEASTVVGQHYGLPAAAMTTGGERVLPDHLLAELVEAYNGPIIVALDCDAKGRQQAPKLADQLREAGFDVRAVDLQLGSNGEDLADFCGLHGQTAAAKLITLPNLASAPPEPETVAPLRPKYLYRFMTGIQVSQLPPIAWLLPGILPQRGIALLYGLPGTGKTFVALDMSLEIAQTRPVVYLAQEGQERFGDDVAAWTTYRQRSCGQIHFLDFNDPEVSGSLPLPDSVARQAFIDAAKPLQPDLIVIDTLIWALGGGDENSSTAVQAVLNGCRDISRQLGAAVLLIHHTNKAGEEARGSSALFGGVDVAMKLDNNDGRLSISCEKAKYAERFETRSFALIPRPARDGRDSQVLVPAQLVDFTKGKLRSGPLGLLEKICTLFEEGGKYADLKAGYKDTTFDRYLTTLRQRGLIEKVSGKWQITDKGKDELKPVENDLPPQPPDNPHGGNWGCSL